MIKIQSETPVYPEGQTPYAMVAFNAEGIFRLKSLSGYFETPLDEWKGKSDTEKSEYVLEQIKKDLFPEPFNEDKLADLQAKLKELADNPAGSTISEEEIKALTADVGTTQLALMESMDYMLQKLADLGK